MKTRSEDRILKRAISELYTKVKSVSEKVSGMKVTLKLELEMPSGWIDRTEKWILKSLRGRSHKTKVKLQKKFESLKQQKIKEKKSEQNLQQEKSGL